MAELENTPLSSGRSVVNRKDRPGLIAVTAAGSIIRRDVRYVPVGTDKQTLDIYAPPGVKNAPIVAYVHGGEWVRHDKTEVAFKPRFFNEHGIVFISINYRLSGTNRHPAQVHDIAAALRWMRDHTHEFGGHPDKIFLMGHSAGCHLATLAALDPRPLATVGLQPSDLAGVVSWSGGAFDLVEKANAGGMYAEYIRLNFGDDPAAWHDASPSAHINDGKKLPAFLFASAQHDRPASIDANKKMTDLIQKANGTAHWISLPDKDHFYADYSLGKPGDSSGEMLLEWMNRRHG